MSTWLYQMSQARWPRAKFLQAAREGEYLDWNSRKVIGGGFPAESDRVILFYAKSGTKSPGICGVGRIRGSDQLKRWVEIRVGRPTEKLRRNPWWDAKVVALMTEIRGKSWRATLFPVPRGVARAIESGIQKWVREKQ